MGEIQGLESYIMIIEVVLVAHFHRNIILAYVRLNHCFMLKTSLLPNYSNSFTSFLKFNKFCRL